MTGASLRIGAAVVKMLSEYGAEVEYSARNPTVVEDQLGQEKIKGHPADMSDQDRLKAFIETVRLWPVDILINNVGASPSRNFLHD